MKLLEGKKALISGVANSRSIAWGIAQVFHEHGAELAFTCLPSTRKRVAKLTAQLDSDLVFPCDVSKDEEIARTFEKVGEVFDGKLDVLMHSIAYARLEDIGDEFLTVTREGWRLALEISAYSLVSMARAARPLMKAAGGGSILTLSFIGGEKVVPSYNVMGVAKAALECAVRYLAYDLGPDGVRVNALSPGPIPTVSSMVVGQFEDSLKKVARYSPMLRCVTPRDVGDAAVFYASDASKTITGSTLHVDSGMGIMVGGAEAHPHAEPLDPEQS